MDVLRQIIDELEGAWRAKKAGIEWTVEEGGMWQTDYYEAVGWIEGVKYAIGVIKRYMEASRDG